MMVESVATQEPTSSLLITPPAILIVNEQAKKSRPSSLANSSDPFIGRIYMILLGNLPRPSEVPFKSGQNLKWTFRNGYMKHQFVLKTNCIGKAYSAIHYPSHYENIPPKETHWSAEMAAPQFI